MRPILAPALVALALAAGCGYGGGDIAEPMQRKFQWFSYIGGDDLKAECAPGRAPRYRFVYNATWEQQVRAYELDRLQPGDGGLLRVIVMRGGARVLQYWIFDSASSPAATTITRDVKISEEQYLALIRATEASGFGAPPPAGLQLPSWDFYWVVNACADGRWHLNAWRRGQPGWDKVAFDKVLFTIDPTGVPVRQPPEWPRSWTEADYRLSYGRSTSNPDTRESDSFQLVVGHEGLAGNLRAF